MVPLFNIYRNSVRCFYNLRVGGGVQFYREVSTEVIKTLENEFDRLNGSASQSVLRKNLNEVLLEKLKYMETPAFKSNLLHCIQSGFKEHGCQVGIYAADAESYKVFADLFDPIIYDLHGFKKEDMHPPKQYGDFRIFKDIDPHNNFILSTRIRAERNLQGYPFPPRMTEADYKIVEEESRFALKALKGRLSGKYFPYCEISNAANAQLKEDHMLKDPDHILQAGNICRYAPIGRGIHYTHDKKFSVWVNYEDHLRIVSMQQGGDFGEVYSRLIEGIEAIEAINPSIYDKHLGFVTCSPINLGTTIRASVLIKLAKLPRNVKVFQELLDKFHLQVRGTYGKFTSVAKGVYDISNRRCLGVTEYDSVRDVYDGINEIIRTEKCIALPTCC